MRSLLALLLFAAVAPAADYHVAADGDDKNPGTEAKPWKTLDKVNAAKPGPGDKVLLRGGDVFAGTLNVEGDEKSGKGELQVSSYGTGRARIDSGNQPAVEVRNLGGVKVTNLIACGGGRASNKTAGVAFHCTLPKAARLAAITIEGVEAFGYGEAGISIGADAPDGTACGFDGVTISDCLVHDNGRYGLVLYGALPEPADPEAKHHFKDVRLKGCVAHSNPGDPTYTTNHSGNGILLGSTDGGVIEKCVAYRNGGLNASKGGGPVGIWAYASKKVTIRHCAACENRSGNGMDGGGFDLDGGCQDCVIEHCFSANNDGAGYLLYQYDTAPFVWKNNAVRYCVSENDGRAGSYGGVVIGGELSGCDVYHCTVFVGPGKRAGDPACVRFVDDGAARSGVRLFNNALAGTKGHAVVAGPVPEKTLFLGNAYWCDDGKPKLGDATGLEGWRKAGFETLDGKPVGVEVDPKFESAGGGECVQTVKEMQLLTGYKLKADSPLRKAGIDLRKQGIDAGPKDGKADVGAK